MDTNIKTIQQNAKSLISAAKTAEINDLEKRQKDLVHQYTSEERVDVSIAPMYANEFGNVLRVSVNCISVTVPCNGKHYKVPATFATEINRRITAVNMRLEREKNIQPVLETTPGEIPLV